MDIINRKLTDLSSQAKEEVARPTRPEVELSEQELLSVAGGPSIVNMN